MRSLRLTLFTVGCLLMSASAFGAGFSIFEQGAKASAMAGAYVATADDPSAIFYTLGITEHACGTDNVKNVANLAMLCGQIGKWASGVNMARLATFFTLSVPHECSVMPSV